MTGYTVHTGSDDKFVDGWDRLFGNQTGSKKSRAKKAGKKKSAKKTSKKAGAKKVTAKKAGTKAKKKSKRN